MIGVKKHRWWRHSVSVGPAAATFAGFAAGSVVGAVVAFPYFDRVSYALWFFLASSGASWGYVFWLKSDRTTDEQFQRIVRLVALVAIAVLLLAWPNLGLQMRRVDGPIIICLLGGICAASMLVVGTGWGFIHLVGYLSSLLRSDKKATIASSPDGVWDRELDQELPAGKCDR
jgi:hypothetical protein